MKKSKVKSQMKAAVVDTSIIIEYLSLNQENEKERQFGEYLEVVIFENNDYLLLYISSIVRMELLYVICRQKNWLNATELVNKIGENFIIFYHPQLDEIAAQIKCECSISLADCFSCAVAKYYDIPVFFMQEREFNEEIKQKLKNNFRIQLEMIVR